MGANSIIFLIVSELFFLFSCGALNNVVLSHGFVLEIYLCRRLIKVV
jgi:hypothetical protein